MTTTATLAEGMPFAITSRTLSPDSMDIGTSKDVETIIEPVATPMLVCPWVRAYTIWPLALLVMRTSG